ncbi:hypothetical protein EIP75_16585 [Aquabacterium soli]|uniref:Lipoprotein n=1 Tax=Aquabacterium soli TaxID=2493092 RepID=A0A426V8W6_9BURK|nr:hypothetical protein [Aquabacterium soli]RRS03302.1 hypothetical protein EIP75_16585 [Aquabacterium soli]
MQFVHAVRGIASACLMSVLAACGGGGGGDEPVVTYPASNTVTVDTGNASTAAGSYALDPSSIDSELDPTGDGRTLEFAVAEDTAGKFQLVIGFLQNDTSKYILYFDDANADYACRSSNVSNAELEALAGGPANNLPVCSGTVKIDAGAHNLRASKVTIGNPDTPSDKVVISVNFAWTI